MPNRDTAKPWFQTGKKPSQAQFYQLLDWLLFNDDGITVANVTGLTNILQAKTETTLFDAFYKGELIPVAADYQYVLQQNYLLEKIIVLPGADALIRIGTIAFGEELIPDVNITAAEGEVFVLNLFAKNIRNIFFTGIPAGTSLIFFKRLVKTQ